jgi:flagellin
MRRGPRQRQAVAGPDPRTGDLRTAILTCQVMHVFVARWTGKRYRSRQGSHTTHKGGRMVSSITNAIYNISNFYYQNSLSMSKSLERLSTGKKFQTPADNIGDYMHAQNLQIQSNGYDNILTGLSEWKGAMGVANSAAAEVSTSLQRMDELLNLSQQSSDNDQKDAYQAEFTQLYTKINQIVTKTNYQSKVILNDKTAMATLYLNPDVTTNSTLTIQFTNEAITPGHLTGISTTSNTPAGTLKLDHTAVAGDYTTARTAVAAAQTDLNNYVAQAASYSSALDSYYNVCSSAKTNLAGAISAVSDTNDAEEIATYTARSIQQQAALAMLSQANMSNRNVLALYANM